MIFIAFLVYNFSKPGGGTHSGVFYKILCQIDFKHIAKEQNSQKTYLGAKSTILSIFECGFHWYDQGDPTQDLMGKWAAGRPWAPMGGHPKAILDLSLDTIGACYGKFRQIIPMKTYSK